MISLHVSPPLFLSATQPMNIPAIFTMSLCSGNKDADSLARELNEGPLSILYQSAKSGTPVMISCRNNKKLLGQVKAFDRHFNMVLENVTEIWTDFGKKGKGQKKAVSTNKERYAVCTCTIMRMICRVCVLTLSMY